MIAVVIIGLLIFISFSMVFTLAICKAAAMADEQMDRMPRRRLSFRKSYVLNR